MCHSTLADARLYALQLRIDQELLEEARAGGCPVDGGRLHSANYERRPRGALCKLGRQDRTRLSLCCANRECRKRVTPPSVRFLGRRVYLGAVMVLLSTMRHGVTAARLAQLREVYGVCPRTVQRWRRWWRETFPQTPCWRHLRGHLQRPMAAEPQPEALLALFSGDVPTRILNVLRLLSPLSTTSGKAGFFMGI